jgi:hypothetical protein
LVNTGEMMHDQEKTAMAELAFKLGRITRHAMYQATEVQQPCKLPAPNGSTDFLAPASGQLWSSATDRLNPQPIAVVHQGSVYGERCNSGKLRIRWRL